MGEYKDPPKGVPCSMIVAAFLIAVLAAILTL